MIDLEEIQKETPSKGTVAVLCAEVKRLRETMLEMWKGYRTYRKDRNGDTVCADCGAVEREIEIWFDKYQYEMKHKPGCKVQEMQQLVKELEK